MQRLMSAVVVLGLSGLGMTLPAQQSPSTLPATPGQEDPAPQQQQTDATNPLQSARSFDGRIVRSGDQLILQDGASRTSYKLDDQTKAKEYEGKGVKVMAIMDPTSNTLHVIDIINFEKPLE